MRFLDGIENFLMMINDNWTTIIVIIGLALAVANKIMVFMSHSKEERMNIIKKQIQDELLKMVSDAEADYDEWNKAGEIKRSQVMNKIYNQYPILSKIADQEDLTRWIDEEIDNALPKLKDTIKKER